MCYQEVCVQKKRPPRVLILSRLCSDALLLCHMFKRKSLEGKVGQSAVETPTLVVFVPRVECEHHV